MNHIFPYIFPYIYIYPYYGSPVQRNTKKRLTRDDTSRPRVGQKFFSRSALRCLWTITSTRCFDGLPAGQRV